MESIYNESVRKNVFDAMEYYAGCILGLNIKQMSNKNVRLLQKDITSFIAWYNMKHLQNKKGGYTDENLSNEELISIILAAYVDTALCLSKIMSPKRRLEEASTILLKASLFLSNKTNYLDIILNTRYLNETHLDLMKPICRKCLTQKLNSDPQTYTKMVLLIKKIKSLWPKELSSELMECSRLLPPKNYLKWLEKVDYKSVDLLDLKSSMDDKKIRDHLTRHVKVEVLDSFLLRLNRKIKTLSPTSIQSFYMGKVSQDDIHHLSDDEDVKKDSIIISSSNSDSDDADDDINFWGKKLATAINPGRLKDGSVEETDEEYEIVAMETDSIGDLDGDSMDGQTSINEIDLTCDDDDDDVDDKMNDDVENKRENELEMKTSSSRPEKTSLKRKHESDDDDDDDDEVEDVPKQKKMKHSIQTEISKEQINVVTTPDEAVVKVADRCEEDGETETTAQEDSNHLEEEDASVVKSNEITEEATMESESEMIREIVTNDDDDDVKVTEVFMPCENNFESNDADAVASEVIEGNHDDDDKHDCGNEVHQHDDDDDDDDDEKVNKDEIVNVDDSLKDVQEDNNSLQACQTIEEVNEVDDVKMVDVELEVPREFESTADHHQHLTLDVVSSQNRDTISSNETCVEILSSSTFTQLKHQKPTNDLDATPVEKSVESIDNDKDAKEISESSSENTHEEADVPKKYSLRSARTAGNSQNAGVEPAPSKSRLRRPLSRKPSQAENVKSVKVLESLKSQEGYKIETAHSFVSLEDVMEKKEEQKNKISQASSQSASPVASEGSLHSIDGGKGSSKIPRWTGKKGEEAEASGDSSSSDVAPRRSARIQGMGNKY